MTTVSGVVYSGWRVRMKIVDERGGGNQNENQNMNEKWEMRMREKEEQKWKRNKVQRQSEKTSILIRSKTTMFPQFSNNIKTLKTFQPKNFHVLCLQLSISRFEITWHVPFYALRFTVHPKQNTEKIAWNNRNQPTIIKNYDIEGSLFFHFVCFDSIALCFSLFTRKKSKILRIFPYG